MSLLRFDQTISDWVIFAPSRARRPHELRGGDGLPPAPAQFEATCPFCPGNEAATPQEICGVRQPGAGAAQWLVRVIPNKFPALRIEEDNTHHGDGFRYIGGCGAHEVIVESPDHSRALAEQPVEQIELILRMAQSRYLDLMRDARFQTVVIFKNHGESAGTSLRHPHWQIIATPVVPRMLRLKYAVATDYFDLTGGSLYSDKIHDELVEKNRVLDVNDEFVAILPFASHLPFETWILPRRQQASFGRLESDQFPLLAAALKTALLRLHLGLGNPDFNLAIDTSARGDEDKPYFTWHVRILPRLSTPAGFELGSGMSINTVLPEEAAEFLRNVEI
jgi:UDPglucose--hexose-1-phosphate uridylyltransferase